MKNKLMVNLELLKNKFKLFKSNKFKALLGASLIAATLSSCNTKNDYGNTDTPTTSYIQTVEEKNTFFAFDMNFNNYNDEIAQKEAIAVYNDKDEITNTISLKYGNISSALNTKSQKIYFKYLNKMIDIPEIEENERLVVNVDYATKEITTSIENNNIKTK